MQRWLVVYISHDPLRGQTAGLRFWGLGQSQSLCYQPLERTKAAPSPAPPLDRGLLPGIAWVYLSDKQGEMGKQVLVSYLEMNWPPAVS